ncbi:MAG TPA: nucleotidyltransferase domain-containing protein [Chitinophagales bacterium]|nr:nucleotidyltransferase domain-containing protein [Chitinophagales bacterium]
MNLANLQQNSHLLLLKCISGSNAYGLQLPTSDIDYKGVFFLPKQTLFSLDYTEQVANETNDEVYYEVKRFIDLLYKNNPNLLELLNTPDDCVLFKHPLLNKVKSELFVSKLCKDTFAGYAVTQIKKAKGLNKKIVNPVEETLKTVLDFCYVLEQQQTISLPNWLSQKGFNQQDCGLVALNHMKDTYALFHNSQLTPPDYFRGIVVKENANDVSLSSVPKGLTPLTVLCFNKDGYSKYCRDYREYWDWVAKRNDERYNNTLQHGKNYDAKNMMHVFRLLNMAEEIATEKRVNVRRPDREYLLRIRQGEFEYDDLVKQADEKIEKIQEAYLHCDLQDSPDKSKVNELLFELLESIYR